MRSFGVRRRRVSCANVRGQRQGRTVAEYKYLEQRIGLVAEDAVQRMIR